MEEVSSSNLLETTVARNLKIEKIWLIVHRYALTLVNDGTRQPLFIRDTEKERLEKFNPLRPRFLMARRSSLEWMPPCHGGDHGFESHTGRYYWESWQSGRLRQS